jgi:hypothetical protein
MRVIMLVAAGPAPGASWVTVATRRGYIPRARGPARQGRPHFFGAETAD